MTLKCIAEDLMVMAKIVGTVGESERAALAVALEKMAEEIQAINDRSSRVELAAIRIIKDSQLLMAALEGKDD